MIWNVVKIVNESGVPKIYCRFQQAKVVNQDYRRNERLSFFLTNGESSKMYNSLRKLSSTTRSNNAKSKGQHPTIGQRDHTTCYIWHGSVRETENCDICEAKHSDNENNAKYTKACKLNGVEGK